MPSPEALRFALNRTTLPTGHRDSVGPVAVVGGLLADLGYDIFSVSSPSGLGDRPSFVGWVGGEETGIEHDHLVSGANPQLKGTIWYRLGQDEEAI